MKRMITSSQNPKIKTIRQLLESNRQRRQEGAFVVEGVRLLEEALSASWPARLLLYTTELNLRGRAILDGYAQKGVPTEEVTPAVMNSMSDTETPQGLLAVMELGSLPLQGTLNFVLITDSIRDPGNLGSMLRTAAAAGVQAVLIPPGVVDPFSPKVVRSAMGSHFHIPIMNLEWKNIQEMVLEHQLQIYLAAVGEGEVYASTNFSQPTALVIGGEASGVSIQALAMTHKKVHIPMPGGTESLNAAAAAAVLLFEVVRQRSLNKLESKKRNSQ